VARIRSVKPALRTSRVVAMWPFEVRYFWVLLWGYLDDLGRGLDIPKAIAGDCFPLDDKVTATLTDRWLRVMATTKVEPDHDPPLCRYEVGGRADRCFKPSDSICQTLKFQQLAASWCVSCG